MHKVMPGSQPKAIKDDQLAVGYALLLAREQFADARLSPAQLAEAICRRIDTESIDLLRPDESGMPFLATFRALELAGAINRLRNLTYEKPRRI